MHQRKAAIKKFIKATWQAAPLYTTRRGMCVGLPNEIAQGIKIACQALLNHPSTQVWGSEYSSDLPLWILNQLSRQVKNVQSGCKLAQLVNPYRHPQWFGLIAHSYLANTGKVLRLGLLILFTLGWLFSSKRMFSSLRSLCVTPLCR